MNKLLKNKLVLATIATLGVMAASQSAQAQSITVGASIGATTCSISAPANIAFGTYNPLATTAVLAATATTVICTVGAVPTLTVSTGANFGTARNMKNTVGTELLTYNVVTPTTNAAAAACPTTFGGTPWPGAGFLLTAAPSIAGRTYNICAQLPALQSQPLAIYTDTISIGVTF